MSLAGESVKSDVKCDIDPVLSELMDKLWEQSMTVPLSSTVKKEPEQTADGLTAKYIKQDQQVELDIAENGPNKDEKATPRTAMTAKYIKQDEQVELDIAENGPNKDEKAPPRTAIGMVTPSKRKVMHGKREKLYRYLCW